MVYVGRMQLYITYIIYSAIITTKDLFFSVVANVICPLALMMATSSVGESCCTSSFCKLIEQGDDVLISQITWLVILLTFIFMVLINTVVFKCRKVPEAKKSIRQRILCRCRRFLRIRASTTSAFDNKMFHQ